MNGFADVNNVASATAVSDFENDDVRTQLLGTAMLTVGMIFEGMSTIACNGTGTTGLQSPWCAHNVTASVVADDMDAASEGGYRMHVDGTSDGIGYTLNT